MRRLVQRLASKHPFAHLHISGLYVDLAHVFTSKADRSRQSLHSNTHATNNLVRTSTPAAPFPLLHPHLRPCTHDAHPVFEASFTQFRNEEEGDGTMGDAKSAASNTSSGKRRRNAGPAFYAVRVGRTPGVYYSWRDCEAQIRGVEAECRFFPIAIWPLV